MKFLCLCCYDAAQFAAMHPGAHAGRFMRGAIEIWPCEGFELGSPR